VRACDDNSNSFTLLQTADRGGLTKPSWEAALICKEAEKCYKRIQLQKPPTGKGFSALIVTAVTEKVLTKTEQLFPQLHDHELETEPENNHVIELVKRVVKEYVLCKDKKLPLGEDVHSSSRWTKSQKTAVKTSPV